MVVPPPPQKLVEKFAIIIRMAQNVLQNEPIGDELLYRSSEERTKHYEATGVVSSDHVSHKITDL